MAEQIKSCEAVLHGGDIDAPEIYNQLKVICPVYAVMCNADADWAEELPRELKAQLFGFRIYMMHDRSYLTAIL